MSPCKRSYWLKQKLTFLYEFKKKKITLDFFLGETCFLDSYLVNKRLLTDLLCVSSVFWCSVAEGGRPAGVWRVAIYHKLSCDWRPSPGRVGRRRPAVHSWSVFIMCDYLVFCTNESHVITCQHRTPVLLEESVASGVRLCEVRAVGRLERLMRAHTLLALTEERSSHKHLQHLLTALSFALHIWKVSTSLP